MKRDFVRALRTLSPWAWAAAIVAIAAAFAVPIYGTGYDVAFAGSIAMWAVLASSWNLMAGNTGYVSFGHVASWGIGAYGAAISVSKLNVPWFVGIGVGIAFAAALALVIGGPILKLSGVYFAIATLAVAEALKVAVSYSRPLTGGGGGIYLLPTISPTLAYSLMVGLAFIIVLTTYVMSYTRYGRSLLAIREDEVAAASLAVNTVRLKVLTYAVSGMFAGAAGAIYVLGTTFIDPSTAFDITITLRAIMMAMTGGIGTVIGPVIGAIGFEVVGEWFWARFPYLHRAVLGGMIILVVLLLPNGIVPAVSSVKKRIVERFT